MISLPGTITNRSSRTGPALIPPRLITIERSARSFMSMVRGQVIRRGIEVERVALVQMIVEHRGEQVVRRGDGVEIAGEVEIDLVHRHHLRVAAAGRAALDPEHGAQRGLADGDDDLLAQPAERLAHADGDRGLPLAGGGRVDAGDQHQPAPWASAAATASALILAL